jgi:hypothetical protein
MTDMRLVVYASADMPNGSVTHKMLYMKSLRDFLDQHRDNQNIYTLASRKHMAMDRMVAGTLTDGRKRHITVRGQTVQNIRASLLHQATHALIFWDGKSQGTRKFIDMVEEKKIPFAVCIYT